MSTSILIIDDDALIRNLIADALKPLGCACTFAGDGKRGLELLEQTPFLAVFVDLLMPHMSGLDFLRTLRARAVRTPVFVVSQLDTEAMAEEAMKYDVRAFFYKPFHPLDVAEAVRALLPTGAP